MRGPLHSGCDQERVARLSSSLYDAKETHVPKVESHSAERSDCRRLKSGREIAVGASKGDSAMTRDEERRQIMEAANSRGLTWRGVRVKVVGARLPFAIVFTDTADSASAQFAGEYEWRVIADAVRGCGRLGPP